VFTLQRKLLYCCLRICCRGNVFTDSLPSNERIFWLRYSGFRVSCHCIYTYAHIYILKTEMIYFSEPSVDFQRTTRHYIPDDRTLHNHNCGNVKSYMEI
jgi:hypothetical protein